MLQYLLGQAPLPALPDRKFVRSIRHTEAPSVAHSSVEGDDTPRLDRMARILNVLEKDGETGLTSDDIAAETGFTKKRVENDLIALKRAGKVYTVIAREHGRRRRLWFAS